MKFEEAVKHLMDGDYVQRPSWKATGEYALAPPGVPYIWKIVTIPAANAGNWMPTKEDLLAEDYEVIKKCEDAAVTDAA
jgi:hypothetical protein